PAANRLAGQGRRDEAGAARRQQPAGAAPGGRRGAGQADRRRPGAAQRRGRPRRDPAAAGGAEARRDGTPPEPHARVVSARVARRDARPGEPGEADVVPRPEGPTSPRANEMGERDPSRAVLTLNDEVSPADRQLGDLLSSLGLVDADTLQALWAEARRQRRPLRQVLLNGNYLTLYQMALIEAGNLDALVLGPVRVIDRLPSTPREAVYRVFDPRRNTEAVIRHLSESEMEDAVRPDEFRQRFTAAAAVKQENVACVLEVLTIAGRPAALVEW